MRISHELFYFIGPIVFGLVAYFASASILIHQQKKNAFPIVISAFIEFIILTQIIQWAY